MYLHISARIVRILRILRIPLPPPFCLDSGPQASWIDQARAQLAQAAVSQAKSQTDCARTQKLFDPGVKPARQLDDAKAALEASKAAVTAAQVDLACVEIHSPTSVTVASTSTQQGGNSLS
jgi:multidrug resistance efflux pump